MVRKSYTPEQIINKLRKAEILLDQGNTLPVVWKKIRVSDCTYYRWRKEYGGMRIEQADNKSVGAGVPPPETAPAGAGLKPGPKRRRSIRTGRREAKGSMERQGQQPNRQQSQPRATRTMKLEKAGSPNWCPRAF